MNIEEKFLEVYEKYNDAIFRHCYFRIGYDREKAKDLTQETFAKTWNYLAQGKVIENSKAFLYKVATNLMINLHAKKKDLSLDKLQTAGFDPGFDNQESLHNFLVGQQLLKKLDQLDEKYSQAVAMRYVDDLSPKEIAEILGESENVVSVRIHRGLSKLRELADPN